ncbi:uncharacterized protein LOC128500689 [Spea bombifrons]|uniref:uncharacterized protein LOC128500689 n=1 Tax=Spea bombifrons TaxID=233779 RepID=UPI002349D607|nr:uncharacterized protein LOC128500689 [Spea bombifrons]
MDGETEKTSQPIPPLLQAKKRKLVLHLDLNNTILVSDAATGQGPGAALNSYLTTVAWGQFSESGEWRWLEDCLSVMPPSKDAISYYTQFGRCSDFVDTQLGKRFKDVHAHHMQLLEWEGEADKVFAQTGEDGKRYNWILPSFFYLVESLYKQGRRFSVILRTFGTDLPLVLQAVHSAFMGKHPHLPHLRSIPASIIGVFFSCFREQSSERSTRYFQVILNLEKLQFSILFERLQF